jgi:hypothetical protein
VFSRAFEGIGNMGLDLDRSLVDKRMFSASNIEKSGTRGEGLRYPGEMKKVYALQRGRKGVPPTDTMEMLIQRVKKPNKHGLCAKHEQITQIVLRECSPPRKIPMSCFFLKQGHRCTIIDSKKLPIKCFH